MIGGKKLKKVGEKVSSLALPKILSHDKCSWKYSWQIRRISKFEN